MTEAQRASSGGSTAVGAGPRVSVVIRCYRQATYLPEAVAAVVAQGFVDWEIVIVNDGSPDDTSAAARQLAARHPDRRIRLVEQENLGPPRALNSGVAAAAGSLILVLDADDAIHPVFLERAVAALDADRGADIVLTDVVLFGAEAKVWKMGPFTLEALVQRNRLCCTSLYRRRLWEEAGGYAVNMELGYEDWDFWIGCAERGARAIHLRQPLFFYRMHAAAETTNSTAMRFHQELTAQVMLNHPKAFGPEAEGVARRFLAARPLPTRAQLKAGWTPSAAPASP
jgi:glycosyltransferase involved in cell wall biosynthesis